MAPSSAPAWPDPADLAQVGQRLWFVALALFICFGAAVLSVALPLQRLDPRWQEAMIAALLSNGPLPLIGLALASPPGSPEVPRTLDPSLNPPKPDAVTLGQLLPIEVGPLIAQLQVLPVGEGVALLDQSEACIGAVRSEDLGDGPTVAILGLSLQRDYGADGEESLEGLPGLLAKGGLRHLGGIDACHPDREIPPVVIDTEGVAVTN